MNFKIGQNHLSRMACVYLRQSTAHQVEFNRESTERQYALAERALSLGWDKTQIKILDGDLGKTGQTTSGREDFHKLMAAVGLSEVGAVLALEASRLSRSQADWHKLLDICALTDTLVIDHDGIYNPNDFNDRVLLGFKGTWSHTELHGMRLRLQGAKLNKAHKGELRCHPPTGYVYDQSGTLVFDPDEGVVEAIKLVFEQFERLGTAYQVVRYFVDHNLPFPRRIWQPGEKATLHWGPANHSRIIAILHNPTYTGTYVYGRRRSIPVIEGGQVVKVKIQQLSIDDWKVKIPDAHPAYVTWQQYQVNQSRLESNHGASSLDGRLGSPRMGGALLQGLVICGKCGRRMSPRYYGDGGKRASYDCNQLRKQDAHFGICWSVAASAIDAAVEAYILEAVSESQIALSLAVLEELVGEVQQLEHQWQLKLERARYEANRAFRQYDAVDPENRLVARTLEQRWNEKLQQLAELEADYQQARTVERLELSPEQRQQILAIAANLPTLWREPTTTTKERKEMLSLLVSQVALTPIDSPTRQTRVQILTHTGVALEFFVPRPSSAEKFKTAPEVLVVVKELAQLPNEKIAHLLNQRGFVTGKGRPFTSSSVAWLRYLLKTPQIVFPSEKGIRADGSYSTKALANLLGVGIHTIHYWREKGIIDAYQDSPKGPWWHFVSPETLSLLRSAIRRVPVL
jgi:DNA invertase Pin-like site-specific DNA recombinase